MSDKLVMPNHDRSIDKKPGHWVLAQLGKKVLRPGGKELTQAMLKNLAIKSCDKVVEFAPGMGYTARLCLQHNPDSYTAIEQNQDAVEIVRQYLTGKNQRCIQGNAQESGLANGAATVVYGEAMLTMQSDQRKNQIIAEAARILETGGRYGIHELCLVPNNISEQKKRAIHKELSETIKHSAKPITPDEWKALMRANGFEVEHESIAPMHLLEIPRMIKDEGLLGVLTIAKNLMTKPEARKRVLTMRKMFRKHKNHLAAISLVVTKKPAKNGI